MSCEAGLDAADLRLLAFAELRRSALLSCEEYIADDAAREAALKPLLDGIVAGPARAGRPPRYKDSDLAILTDLYVQAVAEDPRRPWDAVDRNRRDPHIPHWIRDASRSQLQYLIHACRRRDLLTTATPRKASGERTDYCVTLLSLTSRDALED